MAKKKIKKATKSVRKSSGKGKMLAGALVGGALGLAAGVLLVPGAVQKGAKKQVKAVGKGIKHSTADFYQYLVPKVKKMGKMSAKEVNAFIATAAKTYGKAKRLSVREVNDLETKARHYWGEIQKYI